MPLVRRSGEDDLAGWGRFSSTSLVFRCCGREESRNVIRMPPPTKVKRPSAIAVGEFFKQNEKALKLKLGKILEENGNQNLNSNVIALGVKYGKKG
jgi:hypothetical protein